jgi:O-antigen/teichoic acid export membrane protein
MRDFLQRFRCNAGVWSIGDQAAVSAGNFVTSVLLARALAPAEYGVYALLFAFIIALNGIHAALVTYGLSLHGAAQPQEILERLCGQSLALTLVLSTALGFVIVGVALALHQPAAAPWAFLALLCWELQETTRRALMAALRHGAALWGDIASYVGQAAIVLILVSRHEISLVTAFAAIAATSALGAAIQSAQLRLRWLHFAGATALIPAFWRLGRWTMLANFARGLTTQIFIWILALRSMGDVGAFQSLMNVLGVTNPILFSLSNLLVPLVAASASKNGGPNSSPLRATFRYSSRAGALLLPYYAVILAVPIVALRIFYGADSAYLTFGPDLRILVFGYVFLFLSHVLAAHEYGEGRSDIVFRCQLAGAVVALATGLPLAMRYGVLGACWAFGITFAIQTLIFGWYLRRRNSAEHHSFAAAAFPRADQGEA